MSSIANYNHIVKFIPGLTRYRYSVANLHRLQFGRGASVEHQPLTRVFSECSATVRKSLQGLDYYAAEGAQAFDNLIKIVHQMGELISNSTWETTTTESLKTSKHYLKGDYKVGFVGDMFEQLSRLC